MVMIGRIALGLDQAGKTGWGLAPERGPIVRHGLATTDAQWMAVVRLALEYAGNDPKRLFVMFEQHDHMPLGRLGKDDHETTRRHGTNKYAPQISTKTVIGMGENAGIWKGFLLWNGVPRSHFLQVRPTTWRARIHGVQRADLVKQAAVDWASKEVGETIASHDHAEGICITAWAAIDGFGRYDALKTKARMEARVARELGKQGALFDVAPSNDNGTTRKAKS